jgi:hypothetical protein
MAPNRRLYTAVEEKEWSWLGEPLGNGYMTWVRSSGKGDDHGHGAAVNMENRTARRCEQQDAWIERRRVASTSGITDNFIVDKALVDMQHRQQGRPVMGALSGRRRGGCGAPARMRTPTSGAVQQRAAQSVLARRK